MPSCHPSGGCTRSKAAPGSPARAHGPHAWARRRPSRAAKSRRSHQSASVSSDGRRPKDFDFHQTYTNHKAQAHGSGTWLLRKRCFFGNLIFMCPFVQTHVSNRLHTKGKKDSSTCRAFQVRDEFHKPYASITSGWSRAEANLSCEWVRSCH